MAFLAGPVNVVELKDGVVSVGHSNNFRTVYNVSRRSFDEEVADLEKWCEVTRRYTIERMVIRKIKVVATRRK